MKSSLIHLLFFLFFFCFYVNVDCQASDSCASNLAFTNLIPFNTSSLDCLTALKSANFVFRYGKAGLNLWSFVLSAADPKSYVAVGFSSDGQMVGSSAVAGWLTASGGAGVAKQYSLGGKTSGKCPPDQGALQLRGAPVVALQSSRLYLAFQLDVDQPPPYLIFAVGPANSVPSSNYLLPVHRSEGSFSMNYAAGGAANSGAGAADAGDGDSEVEEGTAFQFGQKRLHALLVILGWGVLVPVGLVVARYFKHWDPLWFYSHLSIQGIGFGLGLAGIIVGFDLDDEGIDGFGVHEGLGIAILIGGCLQVTALLARPNKASKVRKYWNLFHHNVGRATIILAAANIFYGLKLAGEANSWNIAYGVFLAVWSLITMFLEVRMLMSDY